MCPEPAIKYVDDLCEVDLITVIQLDVAGRRIEVDSNVLSEAKKGVANAQFKIAEIYFDNKLYQHTKVWCTLLSEKEHFPAQMMMGKLYADHHLHVYGTTAIKHAEEWFNKAYLNDPKNASLEVGLYYFEKKGNSKMAFKWFMKGALMGDYVTQYWVGKYYNGYMYGCGVVPDHIKAMEWFQKSADQGHQESIKEINYLNGKGYYSMSKIREKQALQTETAMTNAN